MPTDTPPTPTDLITRSVRELRERRGFTQEQLAERVTSLGVVLHQSAIARIEKGHRKVTLEEAVRIALALDVPLGAIFLPLDNTTVSLAPAFQLSGNEAHRWLAGEGHIPWADGDGDLPIWPPIDELVTDVDFGDRGPRFDHPELEERRRFFESHRPLQQQRAYDRPGIRYLDYLARLYVRLQGSQRFAEPDVIDSMRFTLDRMADELERQRLELDRLETEGSDR